MQTGDDWQGDLHPRRIDFCEEGQQEYDNIKKTVDRGESILKGIWDFLKDAAHLGTPIGYDFHISQSRIPRTQDRITCQYKFDDRAVYVYFLFVEPIED